MAKPKQMVPKDDAQKMDAPQEQPQSQDAQQSLDSADDQDGSYLVEAAAPKKRKSKKHRALVNMHLPNGEVLVQGEEIELSKAGHAHLDKHYPEHKHLILAE